jgi:hypothetical protein
MVEYCLFLFNGHTVTLFRKAEHVGRHSCRVQSLGHDSFFDMNQIVIQRSNCIILFETRRKVDKSQKRKRLICYLIDQRLINSLRASSSVEFSSFSYASAQEIFLSVSDFLENLLFSKEKGRRDLERRCS